MVPWLAAGMREGRAWARARSTTSTTRMEVSTFPAATAAGASAASSEGVGRTNSMGRNAPALAGVCGGMRQRNA